VTQEFLPQLTVELRIPELALQFKEDGRAVPHVIKLDDRTPAEVEAWVLGSELINFSALTIRF
jgi:hypothetical protein